MHITVIVCTYNRCQSLAKMLESVAASVVPASVEWEVLVVDNNSNDGTAKVVENLKQAYPGRFRYLFEPTPGKSYALNAGIANAKGEILVFVDDDVDVTPGWLHNLTASLNSGEWSGAGGRTLPAQSFTPPRWLALDGPYALGGLVCALFDFGEEAKELKQAPYGANMAFRREVFEKHGNFRTDLGPSPNKKVPRPNEDTELGRRFMNAGERLRYEPLAIVYHPVPEDRLEKKYFLDWWFDYGRAEMREIGERPRVLGIPRYFLSIPWIIVTTFSSRVLRWMATVEPSQRFFWKCWVWMTMGQMSEMPRVAHQAKDISQQRNADMGQQSKKACGAGT